MANHKTMHAKDKVLTVSEKNIAMAKRHISSFGRTSKYVPFVIEFETIWEQNTLVITPLFVEERCIGDRIIILRTDESELKSIYYTPQSSRWAIVFLLLLSCRGCLHFPNQHHIIFIHFLPCVIAWSSVKEHSPTKRSYSLHIFF